MFLQFLEFVFILTIRHFQDLAFVVYLLNSLEKTAINLLINCHQK